ncbi:HNH endonuclease [Phytomonospora endophytica]|uniref:Superfamily II DNA or RNA helicase n=1 Tax=Phytomonospora endophytica TaxID=714109 RepID=A0A841FPI0_9ACTN|nr:HNH endonuclease [Phytomonospora endophytica]MBB6037734.1 superfamily II DNA or RNA helicase [Phytomonospora endophytica]GIG67739.1 hypothetical protein Pen01_40340 [Phytomonospora endophytica]
MAEQDPQRFFSAAQRRVLFEQANGQCQDCGAALADGWHADHRIPWIAGGPTSIENGRARCDACNRAKGRQMEYTDEFKPRPFQAAVRNEVIEGIRAGRDETVVLASPGSGKTLAYQALGTDLFRRNLITSIAVFVPRISLAQQCELNWLHEINGSIRGHCQLFQSPRLGKIRHRTNEVPLTLSSEPGSGFVATYSALATNPELFRNWAIKHQHQFLLVADEAQFCGDSNDNEGGGTKAGQYIEQLHQYSRHTLLLTGTPYRADNQPLVLANYTDVPGQPLRQLIYHAEASYADGVAEGYLRTFEMQLTNARITQKTLGDSDDGRGESTLTYNLSDDGSELVAALQHEKTWKPLVDRVVTAVKDKQKFNAGYRGLISCMQQAEARKVQKYLQDTYPGLRVGIAISADSDAAKILKDFRFTSMDILVTVRMAFIGYDCPQITVVGILTHYRDPGHLSQLVGRGLRTWDQMPAREQSCVIVAPDDPKMQQFLEVMREERDQGLKIIREREVAEASQGSDGSQTPLSYLESAIATDTRAASNDSDLVAADLQMIEDIKVKVDSGEDATKLKKILELAGIMTKVSPPVPGPRESPEETTIYVQAPATEKEQIEEIKAQTRAAITKHLHARGVVPGCDGYHDAMRRATYRVNEASGYKADEATTVQRAQKRLRAALSLT